MFSLIGCSSRKKVDQLYTEKKKQITKVYNEKQIENLPEVVQKYFKYALNDGQKYVQSLELKHSGSFKTAVGKKAVAIKGEQYFTTNPPAFVWIGKTKQFKAYDSYINSKGNLSVYLFGKIRIVNSEGSHVDQAELLRFIGESVWMPTNLLPSEILSWSGIDSNSAKLELTHNGIKVYYIVDFNSKGQITKLTTERFMEKGSKEKWTGKVGNYQKVNGMMIPMHIEASWMLKEGKHTYAVFDINKIEHKF